MLRLHLADLYDLRGRYPEAEEVLRDILKPENEPNNVVALNNLACLLAFLILLAAAAAGVDLYRVSFGRKWPWGPAPPAAAK